MRGDINAVNIFSAFYFIDVQYNRSIMCCELHCKNLVKGLQGKMNFIRKKNLFLSNSRGLNAFKP